MDNDHVRVRFARRRLLLTPHRKEGAFLIELAIAKKPHQSRLLGASSPLFFYYGSTVPRRVGDGLGSFDGVGIS